MTPPRPKVKVLGLLGLVLLLALSGALALSSCRPKGVAPPVETAQPEVGDPAPAATFTLAGDGATITLPEASSGKPYALLFFSYG